MYLTLFRWKEDMSETVVIAQSGKAAWKLRMTQGMIVCEYKNVQPVL